MIRLLIGVAAVAAAALVANPVRADGPMTPLGSASSHDRVESPPASAQAGPTAQRAAERPSSGRHAAGGVKAGRWEFTSRLSVAGNVKAPLPVELLPPGQTPAIGMTSLYTACIESDNAVPSQLAPGCTLDNRRQEGPRIAWSMSCPATHVRADGIARYDGDRMEATMVSHLRGAGGAITNMTQHITGRYLGACTEAAARTAALPLPPKEAAGSAAPAPQQPAAAEARPAATAAIPPAPTTAAPPPTSAPAPAAAAAPVATATIPPAPSSAPPPPSEKAAPPPAVASVMPQTGAAAEPNDDQDATEPAERGHRHHHGHRRHARRHYRHHHYRGYYAGGWADRGAAFGGPPPYSNSGL